MRTVKIIAVLFAATAALGAGACGSDEPRDRAAGEQRPETTAGDTQEKDAENKAEDAGDRAEDVEIVACESGAGIGVSATVEVTNSLAEPMEYIGTIDFLDAAGAQLSEGVFNTGTLQPGEKATEEVPAANVYEVVRGATCELVEVKLDEPV
jgi:hypothetical protein